MESLPRGIQTPFTFVTDSEFENVVAYFVKSDNEKVLAKFAYPALTGHITLTKVDALHYSGVLLSDATVNEATGKVRIDVKAFVNGNYHPIGSANITAIQNNTVGGVEKW